MLERSGFPADCPTAIGTGTMGRCGAISRVVMLLIAAVSLPGFVCGAYAQRLPCSKVIAMSNRLTREAPTKSRNPVYIGRRLDVEAFWVEKCLLAYGRRVTHPVRLSDERREELEEHWETWSGEGVVSEQGDVERRRESRRGKVPEGEEETGWEGYNPRYENQTEQR